ncbi:Arfaptin-like domain protein, partial [Cooperia oncophora]
LSRARGRVQGENTCQYAREREREASEPEELEYHSLNEGLYRVETGNYEYRLMLRCRQETRQKFVQMRNDVMIKIELLDQKHVRDIAQHLANMATAMKDCLAECSAALQNTQNTPIEIDIIQASHLKQALRFLIQTSLF